MTKSELIERIVTHQGLLSSKDVELAIKTMLEQMSQCLATGDRIEIRGFGSFSLHYRAPRVGVTPRPASRSASKASSYRTSSPAKSCATGSTKKTRPKPEHSRSNLMRNLKRALAAIFVLLLAAVVLFFVLENQQPVALVLFGWAAPEMPVAVLVLAALVIGLAIGPLLGAYGVQRSKRKIKASARQAALSGN